MRSAASREETRRALWPDPEKAPRRTVVCRHCDKRNRVAVDVASLFPERCDCGGCGKPLFHATEEPLAGLPSLAYEHPLDRSSLELLRSVPGFPALLKAILGQLGERSTRLLFLSTHVRCGPDQVPELVRLLERARASLDIAARPPLFLGESPTMNAYTWGVEEPTIVVHAALLDQLDDDEVASVLAHELGHIHASHVLYRTLAELLHRGGAIAGAALGAGLGAVLTWPLRLALLKWSRASELTCDRAALLGSRDLAATLSVLVKFAGGGRPGTARRGAVALAPFVAQARELAKLEAESVLDGLMAGLLTLDQTHPFTAWRVMHLLEWVESGAPLEILAGRYPRSEGSRPACPTPTSTPVPA